MILLLLLLALPIFFVLVHQKRHSKNEETHLPPGPPGLPFIGNLHQLDRSALHLHLWQLSQKFGPLMSLKLANVRTLVISSAKMAKEVFKNHDLEFSSRPTMVGQKKLSYNQLDMAFSPNNHYWREIRKICVLHLFNSKRVQSFRPIREDEVSRMMKKISNHAASSKLVNLSELALSLASSITCREAFGRRYDEEGQENRRFHNLLSEAQAMMAGFFFSDYFPWMGWMDRLNGMKARLEKNFKDLDSFYQELIDDHLKPRGQRPAEEDVIDILLQLKNDRSTSIHLTVNHIKAVLMNLFIGGSETRAAVIVWVMTALMKNPEILKKLKGEVRILVGKKIMVDEEDVQHLRYLKAVIKEALRLFPPAPLFVPHETMGRCVIGGYIIEPKTLVYINAWAIGRDPEAWESPEEFLPDRFLNGDLDSSRVQEFGYIPFGVGRRGCPGANLGMAVVELAVANLVHVFDWELPIGMKEEDVDTEVIPGITMHKKNALCLLPKICNLGE
ncbi:hypothetical protein NMG60_11016169 [Bertholletia excelsa]